MLHTNITVSRLLLANHNNNERLYSPPCTLVDDKPQQTDQDILLTCAPRRRPRGGQTHIRHTNTIPRYIRTMSPHQHSHMQNYASGSHSTHHHYYYPYPSSDPRSEGRSSPRIPTCPYHLPSHYESSPSPDEVHARFATNPSIPSKHFSTTIRNTVTIYAVRDSVWRVCPLRR